MIKEKIIKRKSNILTYGLTPPKKNNSKEKLMAISEKQLKRIRSIDVDALVIYDIQDEAERNNEKRPFPFIETLEPDFYSDNYLNGIGLDRVIYTCVGKYNKEELVKKINNNKDNLLLFVGAASKNQKVKMSLSKAYKNLETLNNNILLGGVTIPERHMKNRDEHLRILNKKSNGCKFFISQAVYNIEGAKNFLSDYYYYCMEKQIDTLPIIFTLTPCGSLKTLEFMKWLGINIPIWLENELTNSKDILYDSVELEKKIFREIYEYGIEKKIPIGFNIESLSIRKVEIDASIELVNYISEFYKIS
ncbi:MAG: methylenetetrahydrofolate reductase [Clostridiales bacterium]